MPDASNDAETQAQQSKPAHGIGSSWERHSCPMLFDTLRERASPTSGDKRLKPAPTKILAYSICHGLALPSAIHARISCSITGKAEEAMASRRS